MVPFLFIAWKLDESELEFQAGNEGLFLGDGVLGLFDEVLGGALDIVWIHHALIQSI